MNCRLLPFRPRRVAASSVALAIASLLAASTGNAAAPDRHVVIVCIDGFAAYLLNDPKAPVPTVRKLAKAGVVVEGGIRVSNPSITWPNHTTLVTGVRPEKHGVLANGMLVRGAPEVPVFVDPKKDQRDLVRVPTLFEAARAAGMTTAEVNWPCMRGSQSLDDSFPDVPEQVKHMTPRLREELISRGILADATDKTFIANSPPSRDLIWMETTCHLLRERKPNLLVLHLLNVDSTHHAEGAQSPPGYTANGFADMCLARVVAAVDEAGIRDKTTIIVLADHGFTLTPKAIRPNVLLRQQGLLTVTGAKISTAQVHVVPEGGIGLVYCTNPGTAPADRERAAKIFAGQEGVADIVTPERMHELGMPHPREYSQAPDLVLVAKDGYGVSGSAEGETFVALGTEARLAAGSHGFVSTEPKMNAVCVISGAGIRAGATVPTAENIDIAPTVAKLLGLTKFQADGKVLEAALATK